MCSEDALVAMVDQVVVVVDGAEPANGVRVVARALELVPNHEAALTADLAPHVHVRGGDAVLVYLLHVVPFRVVALSRHPPVDLV